MTRMPLKGHPYHDKSDDQLKFIIKDAGEAAKAMKGMDDKAEAKYLDQVNDASTVLHYRRNLKGNTVMKEDIQAMLAAVVGPNKDYQQAEAMFNNIMVTKVQSAIEASKVEVADKMFNGGLSEDVSIKGHPGSTYHDECEEVRGNKAPHKDAGEPEDDENVPSKKGGEQKAPLSENEEVLSELSVRLVKSAKDGIVNATAGSTHATDPQNDTKLRVHKAMFSLASRKLNGTAKVPAKGGIVCESDLFEMATKTIKSTKEMEVGDQCNTRGAGARAKGTDTITPHVVVAKDKKSLYVAPRQSTMNGGHATPDDLVAAHQAGKLVKNIVEIPHGSEEIEHSTGGRGAPFKAKGVGSKPDAGVSLQNIFAKWGAK